ncbi:hypothetical protein GCM10007368_26570 [Isoptericola cucumis]|uniref:Uncharacterized protein n=1 Tax=Isoptericola cucumis TaxID=1776856 RepID=A0ABQ2B6Y9_9MICO|nr:hypothetical protein GCM10007368_26570 [Isoptericola cucumis]
MASSHVRSPGRTYAPILMTLPVGRRREASSATCGLASYGEARRVRAVRRGEVGPPEPAAGVKYRHRR